LVYCADNVSGGGGDDIDLACDGDRPRPSARGVDCTECWGVECTECWGVPLVEAGVLVDTADEPRLSDGMAASEGVENDEPSNGVVAAEPWPRGSAGVSTNTV
jgi:hypothetical protein